jgi:hypothetical protein
MPTLGTNALTYADWAKMLDPKGNIPTIVDMLAESNPILQDAAVMEGNLKTGNRIIVQSGLPSVSRRALNEGVPAGKMLTRQVDDMCTQLAGYCAVDAKLVELANNKAAFLLAQEAGFLESLSQEQADLLFYGNPANDPRDYLGLAPRYGVKSTDKTEAGFNIVDAGGVGADNTSIWMVTWHEMSTFLTYPQGSKAGIQRFTKENEFLADANGNKFRGYESYYEWDNGLVLRDHRDTVRIANIDVSALTKDASAGADLIDALIEGWHKIRHQGRGRQVVYCTRTIASFLDRQAMNQKNVNLTVQQLQDGATVTRLKGLPVKVCDALLETEAQVT